ncbi:phosphopantothenoylcysteine decarboxylase [Solibacillus sp. CAU 1738]|uniref:phosphopantothenoylcysteine decarboxylase domain-containing protein n=1 Tax=Solibacillus sp. CAU 1738 TaxID=3140363 RepID=UPI003260D2F6
MSMLQGKKVVITSGGTLEKWDRVRGHTNLSKGIMGCYLAEAALDEGAEVIYMHGYFAKLPTHQKQMRTMSFEGIEDLGEQLHNLLQQEKIDIVIMAAAGSDWVIDKVYNQSGIEMTEQGKMPSDEPPIIHFKKAPKILPKIKKWAPSVILVGFKLEATTDVEFLIERAKLRMESSHAQLMVANSSQSLYGSGEPHFIVSEHGSVMQVDGKEETAKKLIQYLSNELMI